MTAVVIRVPEVLSAFSVFPFCKQIRGTRPTDDLIFDFIRTRTVEPFGMLVVSGEIERMQAANPAMRVSCRNVDHMSYAAHMGFFRSCGFAHGRQPGEAFGSRTYIPLTFFQTEELRRAAALTGHEVGDEIESQSKRLSETLCGESEGDAFETLAYSMREIMRNSVEHANVQRFGVCAQYWPTKGKAEVAIVDAGIGLRESLANNPHIAAASDKDAINYALMPAVSGKAFKGSRRPSGRSPWSNSGFGLYMTSRICRNGGNFFIATGKTGVLLTSGKDGKRYIDADIPGTAVRLTIRTEHQDSLRAALEKYRFEGYEIQKKYAEIVNIDPSSASMMLSQDFDLGLWDRLLSSLRSR